MTILLGGVLVLLLVIGIAFGTSALVFPVIIAGLIAVGIAIAYVMRRGSRQMGSGAARFRAGRRSPPAQPRATARAASVPLVASAGEPARLGRGSPRRFDSRSTAAMQR